MWIQEFVITPRALEQGGSESLHRMQRFEPMRPVQDRSTDTSYSGLGLAEVRITAQGQRIQALESA